MQMPIQGPECYTQHKPKETLATPIQNQMPLHCISPPGQTHPVQCEPGLSFLRRNPSYAQTPTLQSFSSCAVVVAVVVFKMRFSDKFRNSCLQGEVKEGSCYC